MSRTSDTSFSALRRAVHAEIIRLGGRRGPIARVSIPIGFVLPVMLTLIIGGVAESLHSDTGLIQVREVTTTSSVYWVIALGVTVHTAVSASVQASSQRGDVGELGRHLVPSSAISLCSRWLVTAVVGAACSFIACLLLMVALPIFFPAVYSQVDATSAEGIRFLWAVPLHCLAACAIGIGVGALVRSPAAAVTILTVWSLLIENALIYIPYGGKLVGWMPFLNGIYGTGQNIALSPPWGPNMALAYFTSIGAAFMIAGIVSTRTHRSFT